MYTSILKYVVELQYFEGRLHQICDLVGEVHLVLELPKCLSDMVSSMSTRMIMGMVHWKEEKKILRLV